MYYANNRSKSYNQRISPRAYKKPQAERVGRHRPIARQADTEARRDETSPPYKSQERT